MDRLPSVPIREHFATLADPRRANARHRLLDILIIALYAGLCGAEGWEDSEAYGQTQAAWFAQLLALPHGIPSDDTFRRGLVYLDPDAFIPCVLPWPQALRERSAGKVVTMDGTTLRRSFDRATSKAAIHMVRTWANTHRLVFGQLKVDDKFNEITAIPQLLALLDLRGCLVTIDAMGWQKDIARTIIQQEPVRFWC
jgi:hypothetical protein